MSLVTAALMCLLNNPSIYIYEREFEASGYSSSVDETDSSPDVSADGTRLSQYRNHFGIVAANCLQFRTIVFVSGKGYVVHDRMHPRYKCNLDLLFQTRQEAIKFGRRKVKATVYERITIQRAMCYD